MRRLCAPLHGQRVGRVWPSLTRCRLMSVFAPHASLQQSPLPLRTTWLASLDAIAESAADQTWQIDLVSIREAALPLGCRTPSEEAAFLRDAASALAGHVVPVESLTLHVNDGSTLLAAAQLLGQALTAGRLTQLSIVVQPPSPSSSPGRDDPHSGASALTTLLHTIARLERAQSLRVFELRVTEAPWDDAATSALAELVSVLRLRSLTLNHVPLRNGPHAALDALSAALGRSCSTLESLDLKGMGPLLRHTSLLRKSTNRRTGSDEAYLGHCHCLRHLDVGHTQLGDVHMMSLLAALRDAIGGWTQLVGVGLAQCDVSTYAVGLMRRDVPASPSFADGEAVDDATLPSSAAAQARVESLNLSSNALGDAVAFELASCLVACRRLRLVDLRHNRLTRRSAGALLSGLSHATELRTLRLRANRLQDDGLAQIVPLFRFWPSLVELDLTRCHLTCASLPALASALPLLEQLRVLSLAGNDLHMRQPAPSPHHSGAGDGSDDKADVKLFAYDPGYMRGGDGGGRQSLKVPTSYELDRRDRETGRVRYRGPALDDGGDGKETSAPVNIYSAFGGALNSCRSLETLDLSDTSLSDDGFVGLTSVGLALPALKELNLSANPLFRGVPALDSLIALLWCTERLETLDLSFTAFGDLGLSMLCDGAVTAGADNDRADAAVVGVATRLPHLRSLLLAHCGASDGLGVESLAGCLPQLQALEVLVLNDNALRGSADARLGALLEAAASCPHLRHISLHNCCDSPAAQMALETSPARRALVAGGVDVIV